MYICDSHTHSSYSFDGSNTIEEMCLAAINLQIDEIVITDHYDIDGVLAGFYPDYDADSAANEVLRLKERFDGKLRVTLGIEFGQPQNCAKEAVEFLGKHNYEFVLGSMHNLRGVPDFAFMQYSEMSDVLIDSLFSRVLDETRDMIKFGYISSLAHLSYMHRYVLESGMDIDFSKHTEKLRGVFGAAIEAGIAVEINTSCARIGKGRSMPPIEIIKLYYDMGGEMITCGSDAHDIRSVGADIVGAYDMMRQIGFRYVTVFHDKKPEMIRI